MARGYGLIEARRRLSMTTSLTLVAALTLGAPALKEKEPPAKGPGYIGITFQKDEGGLIITDVKPESPAGAGAAGADS